MDSQVDDSQPWASPTPSPLRTANTHDMHTFSGQALCCPVLFGQRDSHANVSSFLSRNVSSDVAEKPRGFPRLQQEMVRKEVKNILEQWSVWPYV